MDRNIINVMTVVEGHCLFDLLPNVCFSFTQFESRFLDWVQPKVIPFSWAPMNRELRNPPNPNLGNKL